MNGSKNRALREQTQSHSKELLDSDEWDFRTLEHTEVRTALEYEYLRSFKPARSALAQWQEITRDAWPEGLGKAFDSCKSFGKPSQPGIGKTAFTFWNSLPEGDLRSRWLQELSEFIPDNVASHGGREIAMMFGSIEIPWMKLRRIRGIQLEKHLLKPATARPVRIAHLDPTECLYLDEELPPHIGRFIMEIDWTQPDMIERELSKFWTKPPDPVPQRPRSERLLMNLATYRLRESGCSFAKFQQLSPKILKVRVNIKQVTFPPSDSSSWYRAASDARAALEEDFISQIRSSVQRSETN